jgi:hypothetical protein
MFNKHKIKNDLYSGFPAKFDTQFLILILNELSSGARPEGLIRKIWSAVNSTAKTSDKNWSSDILNWILGNGNYMMKNVYIWNTYVVGYKIYQFC